MTPGYKFPSHVYIQLMYNQLREFIYNNYLNNLQSQTTSSKELRILKKFSLNVLSLSFVIRVNLLHP